MAAKLKDSQLCDRKRLLAECDDEQSFANRCLHVLSEALDEGDCLQIVRLAHRIKGASASIKAEFLRQEATRLEVFGRERDLAAMKECFARLQTEFKHFKKFIAKLPDADPL
jgi:HPt (histidine-containing phosphotransfer) domain-containing protein